MEELTESARQCLVSQGIMIGCLSVLNALGLLLTGVIVMSRANDILHFTSLTHLAALELVSGVFLLLTVVYVCWLAAGYRNRHIEIRSKYLDEKMSKGLIALIFSVVISFSSLVVSAIFLLIKTDTSSTYDIKSAMSLYSVDCTRKVIMDQLQILFECCGSLSLLDWFLVDWQSVDLELLPHLQNETFSDWDSVPFSCCNPEAPPPCVHHQLRTFGVGSLYTNGCAEKLDEAVFTFVLTTLIMLFLSTFLQILIGYMSRKLQTSARSAFQKGDSTAPGRWWLLSKAESTRSRGTSDITPLLDRPRPRSQKKRKEKYIANYFQVMNSLPRNPFIQDSKMRESTEREDWESYKSEMKNFDGDSSEEWTRRAIDASGSTSTTSFLTTTRPVNSTPETRSSISDTAVANLEVSHHLEHKVRPLYRS